LKYSIQTFIEDYCNNRDFSITDNFAVHLSKIFIESEDDSHFYAKSRSMKTLFFNQNGIPRKSFIHKIYQDLSSEFPKKTNHFEVFPGGIQSEKRAFEQVRRKTIEYIINSFKSAVESRAISQLWKSRKKGILENEPEEKAQGLLVVYIMGILNGKGFVARELKSGIGYVDLLVIISNISHLIELKILTDKYTGIEQLDKYMKTENRKVGHLVLFDARPHSNKSTIPSKIETKAGKIKTYIIEINPIPPSHLNKPLS